MRIEEIKAANKLLHLIELTEATLLLYYPVGKEDDTRNNNYKFISNCYLRKDEYGIDIQKEADALAQFLTVRLANLKLQLEDL